MYAMAEREGTPIMDITLSEEQEEAVKRIAAWIADPTSNEFRLGGFAGTGKTTLIQHLVENKSENRKLYVCAPTGKATNVLQKKLPVDQDVTTIHRLIYSPLEEDSEKLRTLQRKLIRDPSNEKIQQEVKDEKRRLNAIPIGFIQKEGDFTESDIVIVDEASMVDKQIRQDLLNKGTKVLFVGDPGQLPPVGDGGWFVTGEFDMVLQEVHRQALESPIIRLSMDIRNGNLDKNQYQFDNCKIVEKDKFEMSSLMDFDQVLTGKNVTRRGINRYARKKLGYESRLPMADDRLICLKNHTVNKDDVIKTPIVEDKVKHIYFINGVLCTCTKDMQQLGSSDRSPLDMDYEGDELEKVPTYVDHFLMNYNSQMEVEPYQMRKGLCEFDYAYAITVHKSQGSEWSSVCIVDDKMQLRNFDFRKRLLYTAVTRAKDKLVWVDA